MNKIIVIGCPGSGKSTFSKALHRITGIPLYHLDLMYWNADKTTVEKPVFLERLHAAMQQDQWIIDGNYASTMETRIQACDTVVFLDYPTEVCLSGIEERKGKPRTDMPWIEPEEDDAEFVAFIKTYNTQSRYGVLALLEKYRHKNILIFKSREEADAFVETLPRK